MSELAAATTAGDSTRHRDRPPVLIVCCLVFLAGVVVLSVLGRAIAPYDATAENLLETLRDPSGAHWFGTDELGRDVLSRLIVGAQSAFVGPLVVAVTSMVLGNALGLLAGYRGGWVDSLIMRWVDLMLALPGLLIAVVMIGAFGGGYWLAVAVLAVLIVPFDTRVIRGAALEQMPRPYVEAAKSLGVSGPRLMLLHVWPNLSATAVANTFLVFAIALVSLSGLSFLGLGAGPGTPDWGLMLSEGRSLLFDNPIAVVAPGTLIILTATCMNLLGDWVFEHLSNKGVTR